MSTIKGIFEPFYSYVTKQLNLRKSIIGQGATGTSLGESLEAQNSRGVVSPTIPADVVDGGTTETAEAKESKNTERPPSFFAYTTEKQCTIRMASGVDVRKDNKLLDEYEDHLTGAGLARNYVLEGGVKGFLGQRSGFNEGNYSTMEGEAYGDISIRSDAAEGFGIVPMPGIVDATIDTKSDNGSLREAKVNFVCHNRRQLEVLEALYMRPGYPILLEWGWTPYINNDTMLGVPGKKDSVSIERDNPSILDEFMDAKENLNSLNESISKYKENTGGNYDGFIGFCKNFSFKVREDGGYDCVTEIIAHGEILESLKTQITLSPKLLTPADSEYIQGIKEGKIPKEYESIDKFLFYLRAIKTNLDSAGDQATLEYVQTNREFEKKFSLGRPRDEITGQYFTYSEEQLKKLAEAGIINYGTVSQPRFLTGTQFTFTAGGTVINQSNSYTKNRQELVKTSYVTNNPDGSATLSYDEYGTEEYGTFYGYKTSDGEEVIPINLLNNVHTQYADGYQTIKNLVEEVSNTLINTTAEQSKARTGTINSNWYTYVLDGKFGTKESRFKEHIEKASLKMRELDTAGLDPILEGTILKEISVEDETEENSGVRKKIFVRWDLICQILNRKVTPQYKKDHALVELTYLNPNQPTYQKGTNKKVYNMKDNKQFEGHEKFTAKNNNYYLDYSQNNTEFKGKKSSTTTTKNVEKLNKLNINSLGQSFDRDVCLMPHQISSFKKSLGLNKEAGSLNSDEFIINPLTSFSNTIHTNYSIGMVYFNLDYLISTYEQLALETFKTDEDGVEKTKKRLKNKFSFHDWITTIWDGVNDACGGYYDFGLHTEHSRPHVVRVIDFTFSGGTKDIEDNRDIFLFDPQGLGSISRASSYSSKLDNDFASVISIAAQSPINIDSLEAMSFKAFHKNVKNRFTSPENDEKEMEAYLTDMEQRYKNEVKLYNDALLSLDFYMLRMNRSNYETDLVKGTTDRYRKPMSPDTAKDMASRLEEMQHSIDSKHGEFGADGAMNNSVVKLTKFHKPIYRKGKPYIGTFKKNITYNRSAIIPITVSMTIDGIGGIHPLQIFKVNPEKLPKGYQNPNIVFVVKKETQKITSGQDWTTDLTGYLTLLNDDPNLDKNTRKFLDSEQNRPNELEALEENKRPNADEFREFMEILNREYKELCEKNNIKEIKIVEKFIPDFHPQGELSSGGDLDSNMLIPSLTEGKGKNNSSIFREIFRGLYGFNLQQKLNGDPQLKFKIRITAGNDHAHHTHNSNSQHLRGRAIDFTVSNYDTDERIKEIIEAALAKPRRVGAKTKFINEYENPSKNSTGKHFHYELI